MSKSIKKVIVKVPHRISGFFEIVDKIDGVKIKDPEKIGSRGAGFCVNALGNTEINIQFLDKDSEFEIEIYINGKKVKLQIWDFGGEERFRFLLPTYVRGANGALLCMT